MIKVIQDYNNAEAELFEHVGFTPDWVVYPVSDESNKYWSCDGSEVIYHEEKKHVEEQTGDHYCDEVYTQRFYTKHIYRGEKITMIFCNPRVDGMKWFRVFDNSKEIKYHLNQRLP